MVRATQKIGKAGAAQKFDFTGYYKLTLNGNMGDFISNEILSNISFGDPVLQFAGNYTFKIVYNTIYRAEYATPTLTSNTLRFASGSSEAGNLFSETKSHTDNAVNCGEEGNLPPSLRIAGIQVYQSNAFGDGRFRIDRITGSSTGIVLCSRQSLIEIYALGNVTSIKSDKKSGGLTWKVEQL